MLGDHRWTLGDRAVPVHPAARRTPPQRHPARPPGTRLLCPGRSHLALVRDGTRIRQLPADHHIGGAIAYRYVHEGIEALAAHAPDLHQALNAAQQAGLTHVNLDGIVIATDRVATPGPNGADLWWSGKHKHHGGNIQVISAANGWPLCGSDIRPGREHDIRCACLHGTLTAMWRPWSALIMDSDRIGCACRGEVRPEG